MNLDFTAADLLPEFESAQELVNGVRYVVAQHGPDERLNIFSHYPLYREETDSWAFPNGDQVRSPEDYWLLESEFSGAMEQAQERRQTLPVATGSHRPIAASCDRRQSAKSSQSAHFLTDHFRRASNIRHEHCQ